MKSALAVTCPDASLAELELGKEAMTLWREDILNQKKKIQPNTNVEYPLRMEEKPSRIDRSKSPKVPTTPKIPRQRSPGHQWQDVTADNCCAWMTTTGVLWSEAVVEAWWWCYYDQVEENIIAVCGVALVFFSPFSKYGATKVPFSHAKRTRTHSRCSFFEETPTMLKVQIFPMLSINSTLTTIIT